MLDVHEALDEPCPGIESAAVLTALLDDVVVRCGCVDVRSL